MADPLWMGQDLKLQSNRIVIAYFTLIYVFQSLCPSLIWPFLSQYLLFCSVGQWNCSSEIAVQLLHWVVALRLLHALAVFCNCDNCGVMKVKSCQSCWTILWRITASYKNSCHLNVIEINCAVLCVPYPWYQAKEMDFWLCRTCPEVQFINTTINIITNVTELSMRLLPVQLQMHRRLHEVVPVLRRVLRQVWGELVGCSCWNQIPSYMGWGGWLFILKPNPILQREGVAKAGNVSAKLYQLFSINKDDG